MIKILLTIYIIYGAYVLVLVIRESEDNFNLWYFSGALITACIWPAVWLFKFAADFKKAFIENYNKRRG